MKLLKWAGVFLLCCLPLIFIASKYIPAPLDLLTGAYFPWYTSRYLGLSTPTPVANPLISDVISQSLVWRIRIQEFYPDLESLLWNPASLSGYPFLGTMYLTSIFNPFNLLLSVLPGSVGQSFFVLFQIPLTFFSALILLKSFRIKLSLALIGATTLTLGGLLTTWFELGIAGYTMSGEYLLLASINYLERGDKKQLLFIPVLILYLVSTGSLQLVFYGLLFCAVYLLYLTRKVYLLLPFLAGVLISSPILYSGFQVYQNSIRESDHYIREYSFGAISLQHLFTTSMAPDYWGNPATYNYQGEWNYHEHSGYFGIILVGFTFLSIFSKHKSKQDKFFLGALLIISLFMVHSPFTDYFYALNLPLLSTSSASRLLFIFVIPFTYLAVRGIEEASKSMRQLELASLWLVISMSILAFIATIRIGSIFWHYLTDPLYPLDVTTLLSRQTLPIVDAHTTIRNLVIPCAITFLMVMFFFLKRKFARFPLISLILLILVVDLSRYFLKYNPFVSHELYYPATPEISALQHFIKGGRSRYISLGNAMFPPNTWEAYGLESTDGYLSTYPRLYGEFAGLANDGKLNLTPGRYLSISSESKFLDFLNVKYIFVNKEYISQVFPIVNNPKFKELYSKDHLAIYENTQALPRYHLYSSYRVIPDDNFSTVIPELDLRSDLILSSQPQNSNLIRGNGLVQEVFYSPTKIELKVTSSTNSILSIASTYDQGWKAFVNNLETPVLRANYSFQAVEVPAGEHTIRLEYLPNYWQVAKILSGLAIFFFISYIIFIMKLKRLP